MNAVGIDVSKGKSMMMALRPMNEIALKAREYIPSELYSKYELHPVK